MDNFKAVYLNDPPKMVHRSTESRMEREATIDMIWTEAESREAINDFENRFQNMYKSLTQRGEKWFEYKKGKFFKLVLLVPQNGQPFIVIADGY